MCGATPENAAVFLPCLESRIILCSEPSPKCHQVIIHKKKVMECVGEWTLRELVNKTNLTVFILIHFKSSGPFRIAAGWRHSSV